MKRFEIAESDSRLITNNVELMQMTRLENWYFANYVPSEKAHTLRAKAGDFDCFATFCDEVLERHYPAYRKMSVAERAGTPLLPTLSREDSLPREMKYKAHYKIFRAAAEIVDAGPFATHSARHSFCEAMTEAHKDPFLVAQAAGHSDPKTTFRYSQRSRDKLGSAIEEATRARRKA